MNDPFADLVVKTVQGMRAAAIKYTRNSDDADDLMQEVTLKALKNRHQFAEGSSMISWLFIIMKHTWFNTLRKRKREVLDADGIFAATLTTQPVVERQLDIGRVLERGASLPNQQQVVFNLAAEGAQALEIAQRLGIPEGTAKSRLFRMRQELWRRGCGAEDVS